MDTTVVSPDGTPLHVVSGDGADVPVVLLHGGGRTSNDWTAVAALLGALGHRAVTVDLRGHGRTPVAPWTWDAVLDDVQAVVDQLGLERPAVVGHSLGGMVAALWATEHPECPLAVNLDGHGNPTRADQYTGLSPEVAAVAVPALDAVLWDMGRMLDPFLQQIMRQIDDLDLFDVYARARCPLLVVRGSVSMAELLPDAAQPAWRGYERWTADQLTALSDSTAGLDVVFTPTAHDVHLEAPELVVSMVHHSLSAVP